MTENEIVQASVDVLPTMNKIRQARSEGTGLELTKEEVDALSHYLVAVKDVLIESMLRELVR